MQDLDPEEYMIYVLDPFKNIIIIIIILKSTLYM